MAKKVKVQTTTETKATVTTVTTTAETTERIPTTCYMPIDKQDKSVFAVKHSDTHTSYVMSSSNITKLLDNRPELTGTNREKLLSTVHDIKLATYLNEVYRPGASIGDGGTADSLISEFYAEKSKHLIKAKGRLNEINKMINSGTLGLNDLDIAEALRDDLEFAIKLFN